MGILNWLFKRKRKDKSEPWCASYAEAMLDGNIMIKLFMKELVEKGILVPVDYGNGKAYKIPNRSSFDEDAGKVGKDLLKQMEEAFKHA